MSHRLKFLCAAASFAATTLVAGACAGAHLPGVHGYSRPADLAGEWVDLHKTTAADTSIWVLRSDGYDGIIHVRVTSTGGTAQVERSEARYGSWYLDGSMADSTGHALCFSRRLGRFGSTCIAFSLETWPESAGVRHLLLRGYHGEHSTGDRELVARR